MLVLVARVHAQTDANAAITAETERVKAEAELQKQKAELTKQEAERIKALGLPSFEGKTDLSTNAGAMEAALLATRAVGQAAIWIAAEGTLQAGSGRLLLLAADETVDFGAAHVLDLQMEAIEAQLKAAQV